VGAIAGAAFILARRSLVDTATVIISLTSLAILMFTKKIPEPIVILAAGVVGVFPHGRVG
jgi:chromate transporter